jgi:hypothetical protein
MKCRRVLMLSAGISLIITAAAAAAPATYYVDGPGGDGLADGGKDSDSGTIDAPG